MSQPTNPWAAHDGARRSDPGRGRRVLPWVLAILGGAFLLLRAAAVYAANSERAAAQPGYVTGLIVGTLLGPLLIGLVVWLVYRFARPQPRPPVLSPWIVVIAAVAALLSGLGRLTPG